MGMRSGAAAGRVVHLDQARLQPGAVERRERMGDGESRGLRPAGCGGGAAAQDQGGQDERALDQ